jgi:hypothetical protein
MPTSEERVRPQGQAGCRLPRRDDAHKPVRVQPQAVRRVCGLREWLSESKWGAAGRRDASSQDVPQGFQEVGPCHNQSRLPQVLRQRATTLAPHT